MTFPSGDSPRPLPRLTLTHPDGRHVWAYGDVDLRWSPAALARAEEPAPFDPSALHCRLDAPTGHWVAISPSRNERPDAASVTAKASAEPCPLCPGGAELPVRFDAAVFENQFPTFSPLAPVPDGGGRRSSRGACEVIVYTAGHHGSLGSLPARSVADVVAVWRDRTSARWRMVDAAGAGYVMAFENRGAAVGATISHPHGQLYAVPFLPPRIETKLHALDQHRARHGACLGCEVAAAEASSERVIETTANWVVSVPFAPRWPYEMHIRAKRHGAGRLTHLAGGEMVELARLLQEAVRRLDGLFDAPTAYLLGVHEAPAGAADWHLHVELAPPQRNAGSMKVRASIETFLDVFINDTSPEASAGRLRDVRIERDDWSAEAVPQVVEEAGWSTATKPSFNPEPAGGAG